MNHGKAVARATLVVGLMLVGNTSRGDDTLLQAPLMACPSDKTMIGGVNACGKVWKLGSGRVTLTGDGKLTVDIHGLVLNDDSVGKFKGSPDGVDAVAVALICGDKGGTIAAQTEPKALSQSGDAGIEATLSMPKPCVDPVVLVRERYEGKIGGWLATTRK
jgi:hypothetical protein